MPRVSDAAEKLTEAALKLIWESGYGATSVDDICAKADVRKGSFYHFFKSKAELEVAALESHWQRMRPVWNDIFSPDRAPLERFERYVEFVIQRQEELRKEFGSVLGCPLCSVGSEICTQESAIRQKAQDILGNYVKYFESTIRDAHAQGLIHAPDANRKARMIWAYAQGVMGQARICNCLSTLQELKAGIWDILGVREPSLATA